LASPADGGLHFNFPPVDDPAEPVADLFSMDDLYVPEPLVHPVPDCPYPSLSNDEVILPLEPTMEYKPLPSMIPGSRQFADPPTAPLLTTGCNVVDLETGVTCSAMHLGSRRRPRNLDTSANLRFERRDAQVKAAAEFGLLLDLKTHS